MSGFDDYDDAMFQRDLLDDETIEDLLAGRDPGRGDLTVLVGFIEDARGVLRRQPTPSPMLAELMAGGLSTEKSDLLVTAANNVPRPIFTRPDYRSGYARRWPSHKHWPA